MPCSEHQIVILNRKYCSKSEGRAGMMNSIYLCLAHGDALVHDVANRASFLSHSEFGFARIFPLCVYLCINGFLLRKQIIRVLLCLKNESVKFSTFLKARYTCLLLKTDLFLERIRLLTQAIGLKVSCQRERL
jgi:hypothetical protein